MNRIDPGWFWCNCHCFPQQAKVIVGARATSLATAMHQDMDPGVGRFVRIHANPDTSQEMALVLVWRESCHE